MMPKLSRENTVSNNSCLPKYLNIQGFQKFNLKPNSPRTLQACQELGIDSAVLELKEEQDFKQSDIDAEIVQLRYQHYLNRTHQLFTEITQRRKEIIYRQRQKQSNNNASIESLDRSKTIKLQQSLDQWEVRKQINSIYNKTVSFLHQKSESPTKEQYQGDVYDLNQLEGGIEKEIDRYNRHKKQKLKEAQIKLQDDAKRLELVEKWKKKDSQILEKLLQRQFAIKQRLKVQGSGRKTPQPKFPQMTDPKTFKRESDSKIEKREDSMAKTMYRTRIDDSKIKIRREQVLQRKEEMDKIEDQEKQRELEKLQLKLNQSEKISKQYAQSRVERIKEQYFREQQLIQQQKDINVVQSQEHLSSMINKMINKEQEFRESLQAQLLQDLEKKQIIREKQKKIKQNQKDLYKDHDLKLKQLNDKFHKIEEQNKIRKRELEHKVLLKQELRRLKEQDKLDNYERQKRQNDYKMMTLYQKSKFIEEKNSLKQYQNEIIQKTSMEINKQEIMERQRIYSQLQDLSDNLMNYKSVSQHESRQKQDQAKFKSVKLLRQFAKFEDPQIEQHTKAILNIIQPKPVEPDNSTRKGSIIKK